MTAIHPVDQLRIYYAQSVELPPSPERALHVESRMQRIRDDVTEGERIAAWKAIAAKPAVLK